MDKAQKWIVEKRKWINHAELSVLSRCLFNSKNKLEFLLIEVLFNENSGFIVLRKQEK